MDRELTWRVVSEHCNTTKIAVVLFKSEKDNSYTGNSMVFDHGYKYPQED